MKNNAYPKMDVNFFLQALKLDKDSLNELQDFDKEINMLLSANNSVYMKDIIHLYKGLYSDFINRNFNINDDRQVKFYGRKDIDFQMYLYICYLITHDLANFQEDDHIDVLKYYDSPEKVPEALTHGYLSNIDNIRFYQVLSYLLVAPFNGDPIPFQIMCNYVNPHEARKFYDDLVKKINLHFEKYYNVIKEIETGLLKGYWDYKENRSNFSNITNVLNYLNHNLKQKEQIYQVCEACHNLGIETIEIADNQNIFESYKSSYHFGSANVKINNQWQRFVNVFAGREIFTDGDVQYLSQQNKYSYPIIIKNPKYILINDRDSGDDEDSWLINVEIKNKLIVTDFNFDINLLPTKEKLYDLTQDMKIDQKTVQAKTEAMNIITDIDNIENDITKSVHDINGLIQKITFLNNSDKFLPYYPKLYDIINDLENLKQALGEYYEKENIITTNEINKTLSLRKNTKNRD